jgi:hypothetical protein
MNIVDGFLIINIDGIDVSTAIPNIAVKTIVKAWKVPYQYRNNGLFVTFTPVGGDEEIPACSINSTQFIGTLTLNPSNAAELIAAKAVKLQEMNQSFNNEASLLVASYPDQEIKSWPQQVKEAEAFTLDPLAETPLLSAIATGRGLSVAVLSEAVIVKLNYYAAAVGLLIGKRQAKEALIEASLTPEELSAITWN